MLDVTAFQTDLREGMSIDETLQKYGVTLKEAMKILGFKPTPPKRGKRNTFFKTHSLNVYQRGHKYCVEKSIRNKIVSFGDYNTLEDAIFIRNYFNRNGWNLKELDKICEYYNIQRYGE